MKAFKVLLLIPFLTGSLALPAQNINVTEADSTGLPGDNFSLEGALEMFKQAASPEEFEKKLNTEENNVNNLDLNDDNEIDYIHVVGKTAENAHALVLQVAVSETEMQDVAVIEIEKNGGESAILQIVGDEELYGDSVFVEPYEVLEKEEKKSGKGPFAEDIMTMKVVVNVWGWPCVRHIYAPGYVVWVSPWRWRHYPVWWKPWRPHPWRYHYRHRHRYAGHYHAVHVHRVVVAHRVYKPHRRTSVIVHRRYKAAHDHHRVRKAHYYKSRKAAPAHKARPARTHQGKRR